MTNTMQQDLNQPKREQKGWCEYEYCGQPAYYTIDLGCDDTQVDVCEKHHSVLWKLFNIRCENDE